MKSRAQLETETIARCRKLAKTWGISADDAEKKARQLLPGNSDKDLREFLKKPERGLKINALDPAHEKADKELQKIAIEIGTIYAAAALSMQEKLSAYLEKFADSDKEMRQSLTAGEITEKQYTDWRQQKILQSREWLNTRDSLTIEASSANDSAREAVQDHLPGVYAENFNYGVYEVETQIQADTGFTLYSSESVTPAKKKELIHTSQKTVKSAKQKDLKWNRNHIFGEVFQGIMRHQSLTDIAARMWIVNRMSERAQMTYARTMVTGAENLGRYDSYKRSEELGIEQEKVWNAVLDDRTRNSHRLVDGEVKALDETFSNGCRFPGDPFAPKKEIANCRCTMVTRVVGTGKDFSDLSWRDSEGLEGMSYEEWKVGKTFNKSEKSNIIEMNLQYFAGGKKRADQYSANWSEESLDEAISRFVGESPTKERTATGKIVYSSPDSDYSIVYDDKGEYFRIANNKKKGRRQYTDINGNDVSNVTINGKQSGRSRDDYESMTHFRIGKGDKQ